MSDATGVSEKRIAANRRNAQRSTGPRSPEGKAASSRNAFRHGFYSESPLAPGEDAEEYEAYGQAMEQDLQPAGGLEVLLVQRLVADSWRLRRLSMQEHEAFEAAMAEPDDDELADRFGRITRYAGKTERGMHWSLRELRRVRKERYAAGWHEFMPSYGVPAGGAETCPPVPGADPPPPDEPARVSEIAGTNPTAPADARPQPGSGSTGLKPVVPTEARDSAGHSPGSHAAPAPERRGPEMAGTKPLGGAPPVAEAVNLGPGGRSGRLRPAEREAQARLAAGKRLIDAILADHPMLPGEALAPVA